MHFFANETKQQAQARRIFDRIRKSGDPASRVTAERPSRISIARSPKASRVGPRPFSSARTISARHFELATLAEQRDELELAAEHYEKAWRLIPERRSVLVDLGRVLQSLNRTEEANAALLAASRGGEPRAAEAARELLPTRYPYVSRVSARPRARPEKPRPAPRTRLSLAAHEPPGRGRTGVPQTHYACRKPTIFPPRSSDSCFWRAGIRPPPCRCSSAS